MAGDTAGMGMHAAAGVQGALPPWLLRQQKSYREAQRQGPVLAVTNIGMQEDGPEGSDTGVCVCAVCIVCVPSRAWSMSA